MQPAEAGRPSAADGLALNRLFFALWPGAAVREVIAQAARDLRVRMPSGGRAVDPERFHLTLAFLGNAVSASQQAALLAAAGGLRVPRFDLRLDTAGSFRKPQGPWWLGCSRPPEMLRTLHDRLRDLALACGISADRGRFVPHVTIARQAQASLPPTRVQPIDWTACEFMLVRSLLDAQAPAYEILGRWPLEGMDSAGTAGRIEQMGLF